jgi:hypothetical protein
LSCYIYYRSELLSTTNLKSMKKIRFNIVILLNSGILLLFVLSGCTNKLTAKFESDPIDGLPNKTLPGNPSGDALNYVSELETQLKIIATPSKPSSKSLEYRSVSPSGDVPASNLWINFSAQSTNFAKPITFLWSAQKVFNSGGSHMLIDCTDGSATIAARIRIENNGNVILINDLLTGNGDNIGTIPNNEDHTFLIRVDLANGVYNVSILKESGNLSRNGHALLTEDVLLFHNPANPTVSFRYEEFTSSSSQRYIFDDLYIDRMN